MDGTIGESYASSIGQSYAIHPHSDSVPKLHDVKIWNRIVEAFGTIGIKGNPTAIAKELHLSQPSVRDWKTGETTPNRANILEIARKTGFLAGYIEDGALPKKARDYAELVADPDVAGLIRSWTALNERNRGRLLAHVSELLRSQFPDDGESRELHRRRS